MARAICDEVDCDRIVHSYGLCSKHRQRAEYQRKKAMGIKNPRSSHVEDPEAFWAWVKKELKLA